MHESRAAPAIRRRAIQFLIALAAVAAFAPAFFMGWGPLVGTAEASINVTITDVQPPPAAPLLTDTTGGVTDATTFDAAIIDITSDDGAPSTAVTADGPVASGTDPGGQIAPAAVADPTSQDNIGTTDFYALPIVGDGLTVLEITLLATIGAILLTMTIAGFDYVRRRARRRLDLPIASAIISGDGMMTLIQRLRMQGRVALASIFSVISGWALSIFTRTEEMDQASVRRTATEA